jgi:O-antigen ligase
MKANSITSRESLSEFELPLKEWLLYLFLLASPFYMFAVFFDRDWPALWIVIAMVVLMVLEVIRNDGRFWFDRSFIYVWLLLAVYVASTLVVVFSDSSMGLMGRNPVDRALTTLFRLVYVVCAYTVFVSFLAEGTEKTFQRLFTVQMIVGGLVALFGILQYISTVFLGSNALVHIEPTSESYRLYSSYAGLGSQRFYRSSAFFSEPSAFGFFLVPFFVKAVVARAQGVILGGKITHVVIIVVFIVAILFNLSMTAMMSAVVLMMLYGLYSLRGSKHFWKFLALFVLAATAIVTTPAGLLALQRLDRVFGLQDVSTLDRLFRVLVGVRVFIENPFIGIGPGGFAFWYPKSGGLAFGGLASPLNVWVTFLTDAGLLGLIPFVLFLVHALRRGVRARWRHPLVAVYLWGNVSLLVLLTTLDAWYWETLWFEVAMLIGLAGSRFMERRTDVRSPQVA